MFKFDFDVDEDPEIDSALLVSGSSNFESTTNTDRANEKSSEDVAVAPFVEHTLEELVSPIPLFILHLTPLN